MYKSINGKKQENYIIECLYRPPSISNLDSMCTSVENIDKKNKS